MGLPSLVRFSSVFTRMTADWACVFHRKDLAVARHREHSRLHENRGTGVRYSPSMADEEQPQTLTSRIAVHPSEMIPGIPRFIFSVPDGWVVDEAPSALCVVRQPVDDGGFWVNAIIRHDKLPRAVDFERAAKVTWAKLKRATPSAVENGERLIRVGTNLVYTRGVELDGPDGRKLAQMQAMFFAPVTEGGKLVDFFQIIGTCQRDASIGANMDAFVEIIASFRFV